ncbi:MAG TPA: hypothetical protein VK661_04880 [Planctomycetota bacterium]|nr:hypothetical protein [Planctomycetota bacterium]
MKFIALAVWAAAFLAGQAPDKVDNGEYERWSKFKVGSQVRFKITSNSETQVDDELVIMLKSVDKDQTVLARTFSGEFDRKKRVTKSERIVPAKVFQGQDSEGRAGKEVGKGDQWIRLLGKMTKCKWVEVEYVKMNGPDEIKLREKTWYHDSVVGGVARFEIKRLATGVTTTYDAAESTLAK